MKKVFLSGPMRGMERSYSLTWRQEAAALLSESFLVISPLRGREEKETMPDPRGAVIRDKGDIRASDIILVDDTQSGASMIGTAMETFFAHSLDKVVIVFGRAHEGDYWLDHHSHIRVDSLRDACELVRKLYVD